MKIDIRKMLLAGTAMVAVGAFASVEAHAIDLTGDFTWGTTAPVNAPVAGDNVDLKGFNLIINDTNQTAVGNITDTGGTPDGNVTVTSDSAGVDITQTIGSIDNGTGNFTVQSLDADNSTVAVTVSGAATIGTGGVGNLVVSTTEADAADSVALTIGGNTTVAGTTGVTAGGNIAGANATLNIGGAANTFTGAVTVTGGANEGADAFLVLTGAANTFTGGLTLTNGAAGQAELVMDSGAVQTFNGNIAGDGLIFVSNANGVTFGGTVTAGSITLDSAGAVNTAATFRDDVTAAITMGGAGTGTNTLTFSSSQGFTVTGAVAGAAAGETNNVAIAGGSTIVQATGWTANLDNLSVTGTGTILDSNAALTFASASIGSGATIDVGAGTLTTDLSNAGTLKLSANGGVVGNVNGAGIIDADAGATAVSINGNIALTGTSLVNELANVTFVGAASRTITGNFTLEDAAIDANDASLIFDNGANTTIFTGNVTGQMWGEGDVTFMDDNGATLTHVGSFGSSTTPIGTFTVGAGGNNQTFTTTGNMYVNAINTGDDDIFQFLGTSAQTAHGIFTGGDIVVGNATTTSDVTFSSRFVNVDTFLVNDAASATFDADQGSGIVDYDVNNAFDNDGTLTIDAGTDFAFNGYTADAGAGAGTFNVVASSTNGALSIGTMTNLAAAAFNLTNDSFVFMVNPTSGTITPGTIAFASAAAGQAITFTSANISDNSFLYDFAVNTDGTIASVTITQNNLATSTTSSANLATANHILTDPVLQASTDTNFLALVGSIQSATTQEAFNNALEQAQPTVDGSSVMTALNFTNTSMSITTDRLASLRTGEEVTGMATGNVTSGVRAWMQGFGATGDQDRRDGIDGYDFDSFGAAVGMDTENIAENTVLGVAFSYADTEADSDNGARTNTESDSYQFTIYGDHDLDNNMYINGMAAYGFNEVDTRRVVVNTTAAGDFDADQFTFRGEFGRDYTYDTATLTPHVLGHWTHYSADSYTETGAGGAGLIVDQDDVDIVELGVGLDASWLFHNADGSYFSPVLSVGYRYDFADDEVSMTSRFIAGGAAFQTNGFDPQQSTVNGGVGFTYFSTDNWELTAEYDYEWKEDYGAHAGMARAAYRF